MSRCSKFFERIYTLNVLISMYVLYSKLGVSSYKFLQGTSINHRKPEVTGLKFSDISNLTTEIGSTSTY